MHFPIRIPNTVLDGAESKKVQIVRDNIKRSDIKLFGEIYELVG